MRVHIELATVVVDDYDEAIALFVDVLGFELVEDSPSLSNEARPKRWVVIRPSQAEIGSLLARAEGVAQIQSVGNQTGGRVGFFLRVDDFASTVARMIEANVEFLSVPREEH